MHIQKYNVGKVKGTLKVGKHEYYSEDCTGKYIYLFGPNQCCLGTRGISSLNMLLEKLFTLEFKEYHVVEFKKIIQLSLLSSEWLKQCAMLHILVASLLGWQKNMIIIFIVDVLTFVSWNNSFPQYGKLVMEVTKASSSSHRNKRHRRWRKRWVSVAGWMSWEPDFSKWISVEKNYDSSEKRRCQIPRHEGSSPRGRKREAYS